VLCEGHDHKNIQCLDEVFAIPIDKMFEILFSDSQLFRAFMEARKTSGGSHIYVHRAYSL